jgi:hypothetical protein
LKRRDSSTQRSTRRLLAAVPLALALLVAALVPAACGSSGELPAYAKPSATATSITMLKIEDKTYGFRMAYPKGWVATRYTNPSPSGQTGDLEYVAAFADPDGAQADGSYLDSVQTAVYTLADPASPKSFTRKDATKLMFGTILKDMDSMSPRTNVVPVTVDGVPGWRLGYQYKVGSEVVDANSILVVKDKRAYWMTTQGGAYSWRTVAPTLALCQRYFRVL